MNWGITKKWVMTDFTKHSYIYIHIWQGKKERAWKS
jgi:hypothetical protein